MADNVIQDSCNYDWNLEPLLQGKSLDEFFTIWSDKVDETIAIYNGGKCFLNFDQFVKYLGVFDELTLLSNRIFNYVSNKNNENLNDGVILGWKQKLMYKYNQLQVSLADFANDVIANKTQIEQYLKDENLRRYQRTFDLILRTKPYTIDKVGNKVMAMAAPIFSSADEIYKVLSGTDLAYRSVADAKGKLHKINSIADITTFLKSPDRVLRKNTFVEFASAYKRLENSFTQTLYFNYLSRNIFAQIHHYKDYISQTAFNDEIDVSFISFVYDQVNDYAKYYACFYPALESNYRHALNLKKVEPWDLTYPIFTMTNRYTVEETKKIAKEALAFLGNEYVKNVQRAFDERWISWLPKPGKITGAYSIGDTRGLEQFYILMNFDASLNSVYTIVHELGHSMHSLAFNNQPVHAGSEIFFAEIASITNEVLLSEYLLQQHKNDPKLTLHILQELILNFFATTTRQIVFSDFEYTVNQLINEKQPIDSRILKKIYAEKIVKYYGRDEKYFHSLLTNRYYHLNLSHIFRINHFYDDVFYVYKYAIGQVAAMINAHNIINQQPNALNNFQKFLESGNSLSPLETIALLGIDLRDSSSWKKAGLIISEYISKYVKLSQEYWKKCSGK